MATLNQLSSLVNTGNTGVGSVSFDPKNIVGAILCPKGYEVDVTALQANLIAGTHNAIKAQRLYPVYDFENTTDSSEQKVEQTMNNGSVHVVREGLMKWAFEFFAGGLSLLSRLRLFNGSAWDFLFIDANMTIIGIQGSTPNKLKAIPSTNGRFWAPPLKINDGSKITSYMVEFAFQQRYISDLNLVAFVAAGFDIPTVVFGLQDVNLTGVADATSGSYDITAVTAAAQTNMGDIYPTALAVGSLWTAINTATGLSIPILSVTFNPVAKTYVIALDKTSLNYPSSGTVTINLAAPSVLQAAAVDGYESTGGVAIVKN